MEGVARISYDRFIKLLYERDMPELQELTIGRVSRIEDHGIYVTLEEYNKEAYIPLKELSTRFIKHPRELVKLNQKVVVKIYRMRGIAINASMKRVLPGERQKKLQEWRKLRKSMIMLQQMADQLGISIEEAIKKIGKPIIEYYETPYDGFEAAVRWGENVLEEVGVPREWVPKIYDIIKNNIKLKEVVLKRHLVISTLAPDAIMRIKKALSEGQKLAPDKIEVKYISSPRYLVRVKGFDWKEATKLFERFFNTVKAIIVSDNKWLTEVSFEEMESKRKSRREKG